MAKGKVGKFGKVALSIALGLCAVLLITTIANFVLCAIEKDGLEDCYGGLIQVTNGRICVDVHGTGSKVVVLLTGANSPSPALEMAPLADKLKDNFTVIIIEYFGYGLSDIVKSGRTIENICKEIYAVLQRLEYARYTLMAHSISGVYGLYYANIYSDEIQSFVGIDSSVPKQDDYLKSAQSMNIMAAHIARFLRFSGILRIASKFFPQIIIANTNDFERSKEKPILLRRMYLNYWFNAAQMNKKSPPQSSGVLKISP